jgi:hypothetical protein
MNKLPPPDKLPAPKPTFFKGAMVGIACGLLAAMIPTLIIAIVLFLVGYYSITAWKGGRHGS